jgi:uncharacterized protein
VKFHITRGEGRNLFTGYGSGYVAINEQRYEHSVVVAPQQAVQPWAVRAFEDLTPEHFGALLEWKPEVVIFGSGEKLRFPRPDMTRALASASVGFEAMDTKAACRTYNILMAEGRQVVAAILL